MEFIETRGNDGVKAQSISFSEAILAPSASFGGLYVPTSLPLLDETFINKHLNSSYKKLALDFLVGFGIDIDSSILQEALNRYDAFDKSDKPVELSQIEEDCFVSELYHGPTRAFKDMALQPFGYILSQLAQKRNENYLIMAATSGDTGPATLETFKNQANVKVVCLYPEGGTSDVQRLQMVTEAGSNLKVIGVKGNFDDTQNALKSLLASKDFKEELDSKNMKLSAANSVNFGRIIFQIIYHIYSYLELLRSKKIQLNEKIYLVVPSGNFGNALGAYYAKKAGLPIEKILIASNVNNILTDWITNGSYDLTARELIKTNSPAMDILKSSNVERILFDKFGANRTKELMETLEKYGKYQLEPSEIASLQEDFDASFSDDSECVATIGEYAQKGYIMDPHTATCIKSYKNLRDKKLTTVLYSTAEWTKFSPVVAKALGKDIAHDSEALEYIATQTHLEVPPMIKALLHKEIIHDTVVEKEGIAQEMLRFL
ncbi:MAG: threonine synthase [Sulfurovum sp. FS08-3]|nr:MAG: threonine synthase [Sulfurovum sp. FS08-3]